MRLILTFNASQAPEIMLNGRNDEKKAANTQRGAYKWTKKNKKIEKHVIN